MRLIPLALLIAGLAATPLTALGQGQTDLDRLMEMEVTTAARKPQSLADSAASVFVITAADIRRSGATSVPEALRLAPGVQVARINANRWAVSIRGNNDRFANKLLVLLDGRTLYTPLFAGVLWETQDLMLEEIDRIEVIRGPGGALWGANAVNGVINIISRHAGDSQGTLLSAGAGTEERGALGLRQGGALGPENYLKGFLRLDARDESYAADGRAADDAANGRAGLRWDLSQGADRFLATAGLYRGRSGDTQTTPVLTPPYALTDEIDEEYQGGALLGRWERTGGDGAVTSLQAFADHTRIDSPFIGERRLTLDLELQRHEPPHGSHDLVWGLGARHSQDEVTASEILYLNPDRRGLQLFSLFAQDEITLVPERWRLTLGARLEHNDLTGVEFQPNAKLLFQPAEGHSLWAGASRAVRTPSRAEEDLWFRNAVLPPGVGANLSPLPLEILTLGNRDLDAEILQAFELGWRGRVGPTLSAEMVGYIHRYENFIYPTWTGAIPFAGDHLEYPLAQTNTPGDEWSSGLELAADWRPADDWRLRLAYATMSGYASYSPAELSLRLSHDLSAQVELDLWLKHSAAYSQPTPVEAHTSLDLRVAWRPNPSLELALIGQNLLDDHHPEYPPSYFQFEPVEVERNVMVRATWRF